MYIDKSFPITLVVDVEVDDDDPFVETIVLAAYVGSDKVHIARADMTGYEAKNNPSKAITLLIKDLIKEK